MEKSKTPKDDKPLNAQTINQMSYSEIIQKNRDSHKGTFMDQSWRDKVSDEDPKGKTFTENIKNGSYTYQAMSKRFARHFRLSQSKIGYVEDLINRKSELTDDERLAVKKVELNVLKIYNQYRLIFLLISLSICVRAAANTKRSI